MTVPCPHSACTHNQGQARIPHSFQETEDRERPETQVSEVRHTARRSLGGRTEGRSGGQDRKTGENVRERETGERSPVVQVATTERQAMRPGERHYRNWTAVAVRMQLQKKCICNWIASWCMALATPRPQLPDPLERPSTSSQLASARQSSAPRSAPTPHDHPPKPRILGHLSVSYLEYSAKLCTVVHLRRGLGCARGRDEASKQARGDPRGTQGPRRNLYHHPRPSRPEGS